MSTKDNNTYINRPFNIRPICFWAFFVALTVAVCIGFKGRPVGIAVYFVVLIGLFTALQFLKCRDKVLTFFGTSRINFVITIALCLVVALSFALTSLSYTHQKSFAGYNDLSGVVERHNLNEDGSGWFIISNAKFGTTKVNGQVRVFINNPNESTRANVISTYRVKMNTQLGRANNNDWNINNSIKYTANIGLRDEVTAVGTAKDGRSVILRHSQSFLRKHMRNRNADLMYAMMFGDRSDLDDELSESFSLTGIAHVLAVSGLHVGILVGMLVLLLNVCRVSRKKQLPIIASVLLAYCYLCGFRYSILRASIMFMVFVARRAFLRSNDMLSSVSLAAIIILVLFPFSLVSASFQFSFACMLGIALFNLPFTKFFKKALSLRRHCEGRSNPGPQNSHKSPKQSKLSDWLSQALSMYCATFLGCLPLMIKYFGFVSLLGVFTNVLFLPLLVIAFQVSLLAVLTWIAFPLLYVVNVALNGIIATTHWLASLPFATISVAGGGGGYWFLLYFVGLIFTTRFIFLRKRWKYSVAGVLIAIYAVAVIVV